MLISFSLLFLIFSVVPFSAEAQELDIYFTVQVAAAKNPIPKTKKMFGDMPNLEEVRGEDGFHRYFTGNFKAHHFAEDYLKKVKAMGYRDAFILAIKDGDQRISAEEALEMIYE